MSDPNESAITSAQQVAIETTRQRLAAELDRLVDRFKPAAVKQLVSNEIQSRLEGLVRAIRSRPVIVGSAAAVGVALAIWALRRSRR